MQSDLTVLHNIAMVCSIQSDLGVLLNEQNGGALLTDLHDILENILNDDGSQTQRRLVQQQQLRTGDHCTGDSQHLLLTTGQGACQLVLTFQQTGEHFVHGSDVLLDLCLVLAGVTANIQVFSNGQLGEYMTAFQALCHTQTQDLVAGHSGDVLALVQDLAIVYTGSRSQTGDGLQSGGLTGTVGTDDGDDFTLFDLQVDTADNADVTIMVMQVLNFKQCHSYSPPRYASITAGFFWTSSGRPSARSLPKFRT